MNLKKTIPNMETVFGQLMFAGLAKETSRRINGSNVVQMREYNLFSAVQRTENVPVRIPAKAGTKTFEYEEKVTLVNPRLIAEGRSIGNRGFADYILLADDIKKA